MPYQLTRTAPNGAVYQPAATKTKRQSARLVMYSLYDNAHITKSAATQFASAVQNAPDGTEHAHPSGYTFRIDKTGATP